MNSLKQAISLLKKRLAQRMPSEGSFATQIPGVDIHRRDTASGVTNCLYKPSIIKLVQGKKLCQMGRDEYLYEEDNVFIAGVDMVNTSNVFEATPEKPYLSITVDLDRNLLAQLATEMPASASGENATTGLLVQPASTEMLDAFLRLEALLDKPDQIPFLAPMIVRELHVLVLLGPGGNRLRLFYTYGSQINQIARATAWLKDNFKERLTIEDMAEHVHMAPSTFFRHFKEVTGDSPLQFQKKLRLHEAQRLMLTGDWDATGACGIVGYESLTQFNREYKRLFGEPPRRHVKRWQHEHSLAGTPGK